MCICVAVKADDRRGNMFWRNYAAECICMSCTMSGAIGLLGFMWERLCTTLRCRHLHTPLPSSEQQWHLNDIYLSCMFWRLALFLYFVTLVIGALVSNFGLETLLRTLSRRLWAAHSLVWLEWGIASRYPSAVYVYAWQHFWRKLIRKL